MDSTAPGPAQRLTPAALVVRNPSGARSRVPIARFPFRIGRHGDNDLVLRDGRASRHHCEITAENGEYYIADLKSSYGVSVNGRRVSRHKLSHADRIEFGFPDSYQLTFELEAALPASLADTPSAGAGGASLAKLRATLEVTRALQTALSTDDVLAAVVEAALTITGCERGFLLLRHGDDLEIRIGRSRSGPLAKSDLGVPTRLLFRALNQRKEFLSMNFDPADTPGAAERSICDLGLRSVVCVPLVRVRTGSVAETTAMSPAEDTVGLLYMDSRLENADLSGGSRELLTTLALEASTVLENARLLEEQWARQRMEQELRIARQIQESLMPRALPTSGWFRAAASSIPSLQVGGDYVDVREISPDCWAGIVADVSGKGVGAALLASLLQGIFLAAPLTRLSMDEMMQRINRFLSERTGGEQYATVFYCTFERSGSLRWVNAGHPPPILVRREGGLRVLEATGTPVGLLAEAAYATEATRLEPGDALVIYSDGLSESQNAAREFFGTERLRKTVAASAGQGCRLLHAAVRRAAEEFTAGAVQQDDAALVVLEYRPE
ncbi:MAG: SpoIIE family protein phosphatase [Bryobacteraceae bacterium]